VLILLNAGLIYYLFNFGNSFAKFGPVLTKYWLNASTIASLFYIVVLLCLRHNGKYLFYDFLLSN